MRTIYFYVEKNGILRKVSIDMAYLKVHKKIRLLKFYFEEGLYFLYLRNPDDKTSIDKYYLSKEKVIYEDKDHFFFKFPFIFNQVLNTAI